MELLLLLAHLCAVQASHGIIVAKSQAQFSRSRQPKLESTTAGDFQFKRLQSVEAIRSSFDACRPYKSFKQHEARDGRKGQVCTTKLSGDWVLAESEQIAPSCTIHEVLHAYLDVNLQKHWNSDKIADLRVHCINGRPRFRGSGSGEEPHYEQDIWLHSQRVIRSHTGPMRYTQRIRVDQVGKSSYAVLVDLAQRQTTTVRKPFESLNVYVGLEQRGKDVHIYAAGVFEVNRKVVPNLLVFDASGIAGDLAGKGTLWLAAHFRKRKLRLDELAQTREGLLSNAVSLAFIPDWIKRSH